MNNPQTKTLKNATGKIDYTLMNDCMFHLVMQENGKVLKGLVCSLLRLKPDEVQSVALLNRFEFGDELRDKNFVLDIKVLLNDKAVINIELQVRSQNHWPTSVPIRGFCDLDKVTCYLFGLINSSSNAAKTVMVRPGNLSVW